MAKEDCWNQEPEIHSPFSLIVWEPSSRRAAEQQRERVVADVAVAREAGRTYSAGRPGDDHAVAGLDVAHARTDLLDDADSLVADDGRHRHHDLHVGVGVAHSGCLDADVYLIGAQVVEFDRLQGVRPANLTHNGSS